MSLLEPDQLVSATTDGDGVPEALADVAECTKEETERSLKGGESSAGPNAGEDNITPDYLEEEIVIIPVIIKDEEGIPFIIKDEEATEATSTKEEEAATCSTDSLYLKKRKRPARLTGEHKVPPESLEGEYDIICGVIKDEEVMEPVRGQEEKATCFMGRPDSERRTSLVSPAEY
ncbi:uncharacterized protein [Ambystoma mexicanum]|uniref:uncharacterized protein isoform X5 n=1 Tax=Ambystoma mexicanum TaxID=8296 RepID=UPI0037E8A663